MTWSYDDVVTLKAAYGSVDSRGNVGLVALAARLQRSIVSVCIKARKLGLTSRVRGAGVRQRNKYPTVEARRKALSESRKAWIAVHGHPRGALGMKHTAESKAQMSKASRLYQASVSPARRRQITLKMNKTKLARFGTANPANLLSHKPYSRTKGGRRSDLDNRYFRSSWEANYARYLDWLVEHGSIKSWGYETKTFRFGKIIRGCSSYTPDFEVELCNGDIEFHEVKGWMDAKSKTRLARMAKYHPSVRLLLVDERSYVAIARSIKAMIPNWE